MNFQSAIHYPYHGAEELTLVSRPILGHNSVRVFNEPTAIQKLIDMTATKLKKVHHLQCFACKYTILYLTIDVWNWCLLIHTHTHTHTSTHTHTTQHRMQLLDTVCLVLLACPRAVDAVIVFKEKSFTQTVKKRISNHKKSSTITKSNSESNFFL